MRAGINEILAGLDALQGFKDSEFLYSPATTNGSLRRRNLIRYLELMADIRPSHLLVGEAPGYRGTTITGIPFMSCREASAVPGLITGSLTGDGFAEPQCAPYRTEITSGVVWKLLLTVQPNRLPLLWAIYPNHPHVPGKTSTNRPPTTDETGAGIELVALLSEFANDANVVAVGRKAEHALKTRGVTPEYIRHPSRGGSAEFLAGLRDLFGTAA